MSETLYRAFSLVNGGRAVERDLFAGLRRNASRDRSRGRVPTMNKPFN